LRILSKMTVATDKLVYDISPAKKTLSNRLISFYYFLKWCNLSGEMMYASLSEATVIFASLQLPFSACVFCIAVLLLFFEELTMTDQTKISFPETICREDVRRSTYKETWLYVTLSHHFTLIENLHLLFCSQFKAVS